MTTWTDEQLDRLGGAPEIEIAPRRADGSLREYTTIWIVQAGDGLFVRSFNGPGGSWFTSARRSGAGRIRVGGAEIDVDLEPQDHLRGDRGRRLPRQVRPIGLPRTDGGRRRSRHDPPARARMSPDPFHTRHQETT